MGEIFSLKIPGISKLRGSPLLAQILKNSFHLNGFGKPTLNIFFNWSRVVEGGFGEDQFKFFPAMEN